jgi:hypothetical protein
MIKLILAALLLSANQPVPAEGNGESLKITIPVPVTSLVINEGITVVLTNETSREITVEGNHAEQNPLKLELTDGKLTLTRRTTIQGEKLLVYIPATNLRSVSINGVSTLQSNVVLPLKKLNIVLAAECDIRIKTTGKVNIISWDDIEYRSGERPGK